jgi:hypothetical protein
MRELNDVEIESVSGGFQTLTQSSNTHLSAIVAGYSLFFGFNEQLAAMNFVEDYILKNSEGS